MTLAARLLHLAPHVFPAIAVSPQWAALIADATAACRTNPECAPGHAAQSTPERNLQ